MAISLSSVTYSSLPLFQCNTFLPCEFFPVLGDKVSCNSIREDCKDTSKQESSYEQGISKVYIESGSHFHNPFPPIQVFRDCDETLKCRNICRHISTGSLKAYSFPYDIKQIVEKRNCKDIRSPKKSKCDRHIEMDTERPENDPSKGKDRNLHSERRRHSPEHSNCSAQAHVMDWSIGRLERVDQLVV